MSPASPADPSSASNPPSPPSPPSASGAGWSLDDIPPLYGRQALVTGVTSGLGQRTATVLARAGADVVLAARNPDKLEATRAAIQEQAPSAVLKPLVVDLADLGSVRRAAAQAEDFGPLNILVNNAGVMATPYERTVDGYELQLATNHLGHFALTGLLLEQLIASGGARVVTVSSNMARTVRRVSLRDPSVQHGRYRKWRAYGESKLANLLFTFELDRRLSAAGLPVTAVAAHPGYSHTNLVDAGMNWDRRRVDGAIAVALTPLLGQSAEDGALPQIMAATAPGLRGGTYVGPSGPFEMAGPPRIVTPPAAGRDATQAEALWVLSENATGVRYL